MIFNELRLEYCGTAFFTQEQTYVAMLRQFEGRHSFSLFNETNNPGNRVNNVFPLVWKIDREMAKRGAEAMNWAKRGVK
jgi:hypothetical protein